MSYRHQQRDYGSTQCTLHHRAAEEEKNLDPSISTIRSNQIRSENKVLNKGSMNETHQISQLECKQAQNNILHEVIWRLHQLKDEGSFDTYFVKFVQIVFPIERIITPENEDFVQKALMDYLLMDFKKKPKALPISSLFPFLYFMIRDLHIAKREEDIGFYAGFVGSAFMLGRALTSVFWGMVADRYGRKPVIMVSIISVIIFNTLFGLSTSYWMAITARLLLGSLNGLLGPIKAYAIEVCRAEHQAIGLSLVSTAWGIGLVIGPAIGGFLAQPAEKYPNIFPRESFLWRFPYFLPCFCISVFAVGVFISCFWLPETLHMHKDHDEETDGRGPASKENLFKNWPLMSSILVYCVFSLHDMAYSEIFSIWAVTDKIYGGLSFSSQDVGEALAVSGGSLLVFQLFLYPSITKLLGPIISARAAAVISIPLLATYPFMSKLSGFKLSFTVNCFSLLKNVFSVTIITGLFILQNNAVPQHQRGAANGISMTGQSLFKAVAPAGAGAIFSWAQKRQHASFLPGDQMVFFFLNIIEVIGLLMTFEPFLVPVEITQQG